MSETQDVYSLAELDTISFECPTCHTEMVFRADRDDGKGQQISCPCCNVDMVGVGSVLDAYRKLHADVARIALLVKLRGPKQVK
jgi:predicted RNA-binding Zn-ribbon protein involved in translation (DUF1610 family)